jgi:hypothetical protein
MDDGPLAGWVYELDVNARTIRIPVEGEGSHCYRRYCWGAGPSHRIAHFKFTKTLVV